MVDAVEWGAVDRSLLSAVDATAGDHACGLCTSRASMFNFLMSIRLMLQPNEPSFQDPSIDPLDHQEEVHLPNLVRYA